MKKISRQKKTAKNTKGDFSKENPVKIVKEAWNSVVEKQLRILRSKH